MNNRLVDTHPHFASIFQSAIVQYSCQYLLRAFFLRFASVLLIGPGPDHQIIRTCKNRVRDSISSPLSASLPNQYVLSITGPLQKSWLSLKCKSSGSMHPSHPELESFFYCNTILNHIFYPFRIPKNSDTNVFYMVVKWSESSLKWRSWPARNNTPTFLLKWLWPCDPA